MTLSDEEMAQYQRLSNDFVPEAEGPLVGPPRSCQQITDEYAQASLVYVQKTTALAQRFSAYRTVRGDGNCGWRANIQQALAFGYFEALLQSTDPSAFSKGITRLTSLNNLLNRVGYACSVYEDFVDETIQLLKQFDHPTPNHDKGAALLSSFNDPSVCNGIIMHFRLISGAWIKSHPENFLPYTEGMPIEQYCATHIEPYAVEIDNLGLQACIEAIMKPAGIAVQVLYLDQSPGERVNELNWSAELPKATTIYGGVPTIRLLYRPYDNALLACQRAMLIACRGHYDILYTQEDMPVLPAAAVTNPQIHLMSDQVYMPSSNIYYASQEGLDLNSLCLPGLLSAGMSSMPSSTDAYAIPPAYPSSSLPMPPASIEPYSMPYSAPSQDANPVTPAPFLEELSSASAFRPSQYQFQLPKRKPASIQTEPCQTDAMKQ
ncbi:MAG: hypothetical protein LQ338_006959 [Usnochroma carphineum]|nr:MAG: hypothetical protein LQ338_006959 [Usnochroma carphineum]